MSLDKYDVVPLAHLPDHEHLQVPSRPCIVNYPVLFNVGIAYMIRDALDGDFLDWFIRLDLDWAIRPNSRLLN